MSNVIDFPSDSENASAPFYGTCPRCGCEGELVNIGPDQWMVCDAHRVKWPLGRDVIPGWDVETEQQWQHNHWRIAGYKKVKPCFEERVGH